MMRPRFRSLQKKTTPPQQPQKLKNQLTNLASIYGVNLKSKTQRPDKYRKYLEQKASTVSQISTKTGNNNSQISSQIEQKQTFKNFINQGPEEWPAFTIGSHKHAQVVQQLPKQQPKVQPPPPMLLNQQNTGFQIKFVTVLRELRHNFRSPYQIVYEFYHNPEDGLTYFFQTKQHDTKITKCYEIDYRPEYNNVRGKKMIKYYKEAFAMRTEDAKKTKEVLESIVVKFQEQEYQKKRKY